MPGLLSIAPANGDVADQFAAQAERLSKVRVRHDEDSSLSTQAVRAKFVTPLDPVVETRDGSRLPAVPVVEAYRLNTLRAHLHGEEPSDLPKGVTRDGKDGSLYGIANQDHNGETAKGAPLGGAMPSLRTHPLFPPLPMYGPPTPLRNIQCWTFRFMSSILSSVFLFMIITGAVISSIVRFLRDTRHRALLGKSTEARPFFAEEQRRYDRRRDAEARWSSEKHDLGAKTASGEKGGCEFYIPTEGGPDRFVLDIGYYARRVGLDAEMFEVQTEDGYILDLWHVYDPREHRRRSTVQRQHDGPELFMDKSPRPLSPTARLREARNPKYPVLMIHGLLQSAGAFCCNDDDSLAFYLAKSGYDVWLGNSRCGLTPKHTLLEYNDPRMWAWNIRQMGVLDLPAFISRVLAETGFPKLALIAHSQGTTQTFVALAKEQRPDIGDKISVFCALAPAVYAGPLISRVYFKIMHLVSPAGFRIIFGIHSFIPLMDLAHRIMPSKLYGWLGYHVFSHLFGWTDIRWERDLRSRMFQWSPSYVSAESMRWWLGRECFATQKCILATREDGRLEDIEDQEDDKSAQPAFDGGNAPKPSVETKPKSDAIGEDDPKDNDSESEASDRGRFAWYNEHFPPLALWVCGSDGLVDGHRLLRRFERGREPNVRVVHKKIIDKYEHLDVIWAMDVIEQVGKEVCEVIWRTVDTDLAKRCRTPIGFHSASQSLDTEDARGKTASASI